MLPLTLRFEEFNGREKISYLPRPLDTTDTPGSDPEDGDLIYYAPWGNLGFYYNAAGIGFSDDVIHLGTYNATAERAHRPGSRRRHRRHRPVAASPTTSAALVRKIGGLPEADRPAPDRSRHRRSKVPVQSLGAARRPWTRWRG